jgi:hypothetical protein
LGIVWVSDMFRYVKNEAKVAMAEPVEGKVV